MGLNFSVPFDPYGGLPESAVTSNVVDARDAYTLTYSVWTSAGTTSLLTLQVSNDGARIDDPIAEASWSVWTAFTPTGPTMVTGPVGVRWHRWLRTPSAASVRITANKHVR